MSELKPCKLCGGAFETKTTEWGGGGTDQHGHYDPFGGVYSVKETHCSSCGLTPERSSALATAALLRGARIGLEMAAEHMDRQIMALPKEHTISRAELSRARTHFSMQSKMPDTDIMKEISRE